MSTFDYSGFAFATRHPFSHGLGAIGLPLYEGTQSHFAAYRCTRQLPLPLGDARYFDMVM